MSAHIKKRFSKHLFTLTVRVNCLRFSKMSKHTHQLFVRSCTALHLRSVKMLAFSCSIAVVTKRQVLRDQNSKVLGVNTVEDEINHQMTGTLKDCHCHIMSLLLFRKCCLKQHQRRRLTHYWDGWCLIPCEKLQVVFLPDLCLKRALTVTNHALHKLWTSASNQGLDSTFLLEAQYRSSYY